MTLTAVVAFATVAAAAAHSATTPSRGWNSYDSYTWKVSEHAFLDNCAAMAAKLLPAGYDTCVVDYLLFQDLDHVSEHVGDPITRLHIDDYGRLQPAPDRWPSAWSADGTPSGFKAVADKVHAMGMRFGIHIMRGISQAAVASPPTRSACATRFARGGKES